jgi:hypothetical protein
MTTFSPKQQFRDYHPDAAQELGKQHDKRWFCLALTHALAQVAAVGATQEEMMGARRFVQTLLNLFEESESLPQFPKRELVEPK